MIAASVGNFEIGVVIRRSEHSTLVKLVEIGATKHLLPSSTSSMVFKFVVVGNAQNRVHFRKFLFESVGISLRKAPRNDDLFAFRGGFAAIALNISSIDSSFALSIKAQVLTMITSASSSLPTSVCPPPTRRESIFSVSTLFYRIRAILLRFSFLVLALSRRFEFFELFVGNVDFLLLGSCSSGVRYPIRSILS